MGTWLDRTLAEDRGGYLRTRSGNCIRLRSVLPTDGPMLAEFLSHLSPDDFRFRFLDSRRLPTARDIAGLIEADHRRNEHVLAFDTATGHLVGSLMLTADLVMDRAEVAIAVASDRKGLGIGWALLRHASDLAFIRGVKKLYSIESRSNHDALEVEQALGFNARPFGEDTDLLLLEASLA